MRIAFSPFSDLRSWLDCAEASAGFDFAHSARIDTEPCRDVVLHHTFEKKTFDASCHFRRYARRALTMRHIFYPYACALPCPSDSVYVESISDDGFYIR
jgi:hypothetical protein